MDKESGITFGLELLYIVHFGADLCSFTLHWLTHCVPALERASPRDGRVRMLECSCAREYICKSLSARPSTHEHKYSYSTLALSST